MGDWWWATGDGDVRLADDAACGVGYSAPVVPNPRWAAESSVSGPPKAAERSLAQVSLDRHQVSRDRPQ